VILLTSYIAVAFLSNPRFDAADKIKDT